VSRFPHHGKAKAAENVHGAEALDVKRVSGSPFHETLGCREKSTQRVYASPSGETPSPLVPDRLKTNGQSPVQPAARKSGTRPRTAATCPVASVHLLRSPVRIACEPHRDFLLRRHLQWIARPLALTSPAAWLGRTQSWLWHRLARSTPSCGRR
jgi:hypothetical protein